MYTPMTLAEVIDQISFMIVRSPRFKDEFFPDQNIDSVFAQLDAGLANIRKKIGVERHGQFGEISALARSCFEADPTDSNGKTTTGCKLLREMQNALVEIARTDG